VSPLPHGPEAGHLLLQRLAAGMVLGLSAWAGLEAWLQDRELARLLQAQAGLPPALERARELQGLAGHLDQQAETALADRLTGLDQAWDLERGQEATASLGRRLAADGLSPEQAARAAEAIARSRLRRRLAATLLADDPRLGSVLADEETALTGRLEPGAAKPTAP